PLGKSRLGGQAKSLGTESFDKAIGQGVPRPNSRVKRGMSRAGIGRVIVAVAAAYVANGILAMVTEQLLSSRTQAAGHTRSLYYFTVDLVTQSVYTVAAGYLCCVIARPSQRIAIVGLIALGLLVGSVSLVVSWKLEPQWYGIGLLAVYSPCAWIGWTWRVRQTLRSAQRGRGVSEH
ncbi:MAG TPA: hypothetical protein VM912_16205, partial [Terriglobales bacterium]|nr:hypothetical protein [Terriglobales bacterium]